MEKYDHKQVETKWRQKWEESGIYTAPASTKREKKMYVLPQLPYPSGSGLHVGHTSVYIPCDVYARYWRMTGKEVLQALGWDAFGLPAENYAIKTNIHPRINTDQAINTFREQIKTLGVSVDWDRESGSHNPDYYKWTQWFFLLMYKRGLAYRKKQSVNWCETDKTVLANEQVVDGKCERCGTVVIQKEMEQWFLKITDYAERLANDLDKVDWPEETKKRQRDWIGKSEGANVNFQVPAIEESIQVFTTAHDTIYGATFMVLAPEHQLISKMMDKIENADEVKAYIEQAALKTELERQTQKEKTGVQLKGIHAVNPINGAELPIFVADYVISTYGTGAIMAVPGHDERDGEFAKKYDLPIIFVNEAETEATYAEIKAHAKEWRVANSGEFNGQTFAEARKGILQKIEDLGVGNAKVEFKLRDWSVSRQRFWGAPVPMVYDPEGNIHPVKDEDLPVILPDDVDFKPTGQSPLTYSPSFQGDVEKIYGEGWRREVDTLDTFMCSSWYYFRYIDPHNDQAFASQEALKEWMPVDFYLGGREHVNGHLLYSRFFTKVLSDAGIIDFDEPFLVHRHQGTILGEDNRKMSKRWGNVINPTDVVEEFGADTIRVYQMFMGPIEGDKAWNSRTVLGVNRFIQRVIELNTQFKAVAQSGDVKAIIHRLIKKVGEDIQALSFNTSVAEFMKVLNEIEGNPEAFSRADWEVYLTLLAPFAPFITEELWSQLGHDTSIHLEKWPEYDAKQLVDETVTVAVQINGKVRDTITISKGTTESEALNLAKSSPKVLKYIEGQQIRKELYIPGKIVNIVI